MKPETVLEIYQLFLQSDDCKANSRLADNLKTTLRRYILPQYGFTAAMLSDDLDGCLKRVSLHQFRNAEEVLAQALNPQVDLDKPLSAGSARNYRSALNRLLKWLRQQPWYFESPEPVYENRAPKMSVGKSLMACAETKRQLLEKFEHLSSTGFKSLMLKQKELPPRLMEQLGQFQNFWTNEEVLARKGPKIQPQIFTTCINCILVILGWLNSERQVSIDSLDLSLIADLENLNPFIDWGIQERNKDYSWASDVVKIAMLIAKFLNPQSKHFNFGDISKIRELRKLKHSLNQKREDVGIYGLSSEQTYGKLEAQLESFRRFWRDTEVPERKKPSITEQTFHNYNSCIHWFLGWLHNVKKEGLEDLSLSKVADINLLKEFVNWGINQRKNGYGWATTIGYSAMAVAKWLNPQSRKSDFRDIPLVEDIREYVRYLRTQHEDEESRQNLDQKRLTFQEAQQVVEYLKQCCAPLDKYGDERSENSIMTSWQRYLVVAILTYCPVRQREIRELELNRTLLREADGYWVKLTPKQHKAGRKSRKGREYPLPKHLTADLDTWVKEWRPKAKTAHRLVFIQMGSNMHPGTFGQPRNAGNMGDLVVTAVHNATAVLFDQPRDTTPHVFRRIAITYQRRHGRPEQKKALADMMGHTVEEADKTYDEESAREKSQKAEGWWQLSPEQLVLQPNVAPASPVQSWIEEDEHKFTHIEGSLHQNEYLRKLRDQAILVLWSLQELGWAEMHRANLSHLAQDADSYSLAVSRIDGSIDRVLALKEKTYRILLKYLEGRKQFGETLSDSDPLLIGIGNRSGGRRLNPSSIQVIVENHLGSTSNFE